MNSSIVCEADKLPLIVKIGVADIYVELSNIEIANCALMIGFSIVIVSM